MKAFEFFRVGLILYALQMKTGLPIRLFLFQDDINITHGQKNNEGT